MVLQGGVLMMDEYESLLQEEHYKEWMLMMIPVFEAVKQEILLLGV